MYKWKVYIVSVFMLNGNWDEDTTKFQTTSVTRNSFIAPVTGPYGVNGVNVTTASDSYPYWGNGSGYAIDVVFTRATLTDPSPIIQQNSGSLNTAATSTTVTLPETPTPGNTMFLVTACHNSPTIPTGWTRTGTYAAGLPTAVYYRLAQSGDTSSLTLSHSSGLCSWWIREVSGIKTSPFLSTYSVGNGNGNTQATSINTAYPQHPAGTYFLLNVISRKGDSTCRTTDVVFNGNLAKVADTYSLSTNTDGLALAVTAKRITTDGTTTYSPGAFWVNSCSYALANQTFSSN